MNKKTCTKCGKSKPINEFGVDNKSKDKLKTRCKKCRNKEKKKYYESNKDRIIKANKKYLKNKIEKEIDNFSNKFLEWVNNGVDKKNIQN